MITINLPRLPKLPKLPNLKPVLKVVGEGVMNASILAVTTEVISRAFHKFAPVEEEETDAEECKEEACKHCGKK
jgi:hypothetical protein